MIDTSSTIIRQTAKKLEISEDLIKTIYDFYWKEGVKGAMRSGQNTAIRVSKVGTFMVSRRKLYRHIQKHIFYIRHLRSQPEEIFKRTSKEEMIERYYIDLKVLLERRNELAKLYLKQRNERLYKTNLAK